MQSPEPSKTKWPYHGHDMVKAQQKPRKRKETPLGCLLCIGSLIWSDSKRYSVRQPRQGAFSNGSNGPL